MVKASGYDLVSTSGTRRFQVRLLVGKLIFFGNCLVATHDLILIYQPHREERYDHQRPTNRPALEDNCQVLIYKNAVNYELQITH